MTGQSGVNGLVTASSTAGFGRFKALPSVTPTRRIAERSAKVTDGDGWLPVTLGSLCAPAHLRAEYRRKPSVTIRLSVTSSDFDLKNEDRQLHLPSCGSVRPWRLSGRVSGNCRFVCRGAAGEARSGTSEWVARGAGDSFPHRFTHSYPDTVSACNYSVPDSSYTYPPCLYSCVRLRAQAQGSQLGLKLSGGVARSRPWGGCQKSGAGRHLAPRMVPFAEFFLAQQILVRGHGQGCLERSPVRRGIVSNANSHVRCSYGSLRQSAKWKLDASDRQSLGTASQDKWTWHD